ncbi:MAG: UGSC family (seleno)protein, partial [Acidobacteriota bacterium]
MSTIAFENMVREDREFNGVPLRFMYTPHPVVSMPPAVLRGYIEGKNPATGRKLIDEVLAALTTPYTEEESKNLAIVRPAPQRKRLLESDTEENLLQLFIERGWTDGLPIIPPTEERVAEMLTGTCQPPDKQVGKALIVDTQENLNITVETVAIAAVMAGARPEHLPVLLAIASTGQPAIQPSTLPFTSALLVNGPVRNDIGMNCGMGALGPYNRANAVIGRAWTLMSIIWGYARRKRTFWTSQGNNYTYNNLCMAE